MVPRDALLPPRTLPLLYFGVARLSWTADVPALAAGLTLNAVPFVSAGAWALLAATAISGLDAIVIARHACGRRRISGTPATDDGGELGRA